MKEFLERYKIMLGFATLFVASLGTVGYTVDRPAFYLGDVRPLELQVAGNTNAVGCMHLDILTQQVWDAEDRYNANKNQSNLDRLRQARLRLRRALEKGYVCG